MPCICTGMELPCLCVRAHACISGEQGTERERQPACPGQQVNMRLQHASNREEKNEGKKKKVRVDEETEGPC